MVRVDKMVAGKEIPIVLESERIAAGRSKDAQCARLPQPAPQSDIKDLYINSTDISPNPLVENTDQEFPITCGVYRFSSYAAPPLMFSR